MTLSETGFLELPPLRLEYRMIGPPPEAAPTIVMLHEGLGSVGLWGEFPDSIAAATGARVFAYSRAGYGKSTGAKLPRTTSFMDEEACEVLPRVLDAIGFRRGILLGHSDGASIATIYAGSVQDLDGERRGERCLLGGLRDDGIARRQRRTQRIVAHCMVSGAWGAGCD